MDSKAIMKMLKEKFELGTRFLILKGRPVVTTIWQQIKAKDWKALTENKNVRIALIVVLALLLIKSCGGCGGSKVNVTKAPSAEVYNRYSEYIDIFENYFYGEDNI